MSAHGAGCDFFVPYTGGDSLLCGACHDLLEGLHVIDMINLQPKYLRRYAQIAHLLIKYGRSDLVQQSRLVYDAESTPEEGSGTPEELAKDLEDLGPTFVKLGQLLSTRPDILPEPYLKALQGLQDDVTPVPVAEIREIIERELALKISKAFETFDDKPLAAASVGQVHRATLRSGADVVVKVLRPGIRERVVDDLAAIKELALVLDQNTEFGPRYGFLGIAESLEHTMLRELDLRMEYESTVRLKETLKDFPRIEVPKVYEDYTCSSVITMQRYTGAKITEVSQAVLIDVDRRGLAKELFEAYLEQVLVAGHFHADPHPGNLLLTPDRTIVLLDCGMSVQVDTDTRGKLINLLLAISEGHGLEAAIAAEKLGRQRTEYDGQRFREELTRVIAEHHNQTVGRMQVGRIIMKLQSAAGGAGLDVRHEVRMLGKTLMNLDRVIGVLDPDFDPAEALQEKASNIVQRHTLEDINLSRIFRSALETTDLLQHLPSRLNQFTELLAENKIKITADAVDEEHLVKGLQHIANRVTIGVLLAAIIVGAALMMDIETGFRLFGYPGIALLFFVVSAVAGLILVARIALSSPRR